MNEKSQNEHIEELEDQPDAKLFSELFITEEDRDMYSIDFDTFIEILADWVDEEEKISPDIARYMGMVLLGVAQRLEDINDNDNHFKNAQVPP
ncbi:hypothetical protein [Psychrobacter sp. AOP7-B1-24]|uniref:hypothetical protein n=1 Tax=Psychrobacter sp. AOP7-B1-24 TaxID=3457645 RepID=UPI00402B1E42